MFNGYEVWGCTGATDTGPSGGGADSEDWGLCGVQSIDGNTDDFSVATMFVGLDGYYNWVVAVGNPTTHRLEATFGCFKWSEMNNDWDGLDPRATQSYALNSNDSAESGETKVVRKLYNDTDHDRADVCVWAGFFGDITLSPTDTSWFAVGTSYDGEEDPVTSNGPYGWRLDAPTNAMSGDDYDSYVFCDGWDPNSHTVEMYASGEDWNIGDSSKSLFDNNYPYNNTSGDPLTAEANAFCWIKGLMPAESSLFARLASATYNGVATWHIYTDGDTQAGVQCIDYDP